MGQINTFSFEGARVRVLESGGDPWWVAVDIGRALGLGNNGHDIAKGLDEDEKGVRLIVAPNGEQQVTCVSESGLYALIFRSRRPEARRLRRWVTGEVLPAIRRTGSWAPAPQAPALGMAAQPPTASPPQGAEAVMDVSGLTHTQRALLLAIAEQMKGGAA
jgi:prophage antirepressor-like protein